MDTVSTLTPHLLTILGIALLTALSSGYGPGRVVGQGETLRSDTVQSNTLLYQQGHISSLPRSVVSHPNSEYSSPPCSQHYHARFPVCSDSRTYQNCTVVLDNMYTIQYKEECGRRYEKICYGPGGTDCKAVVDPGCYSVPTHSPVQVAREVCYNPTTGERCDKYPAEFDNNIRCN